MCLLFYNSIHWRYHLHLHESYTFIVVTYNSRQLGLAAILIYLLYHKLLLFPASNNCNRYICARVNVYPYKIYRRKHNENNVIIVHLQVHIVVPIFHCLIRQSRRLVRHLSAPSLDFSRKNNLNVYAHAPDLIRYY